MVVKTLIGSDDTFTPTNSSCSACCGFIIGRQLTKDGTTSLGRTEDYPYYPNGGKHNKNFVVVDAKNYKEGDQLEDESNGFTYPHAASEMKYTATYDSARGDGITVLW